MSESKIQSFEAWDSALFKSSRLPSAVLVLLVMDQSQLATDQVKVLFIRRSSRMTSHKGQIGFPGGRFEVGDLSPVSTALREAQEEVGADPDSIEIRAVLAPIQSIDGSWVVPVVGSVEKSQFLPTPNRDEIDQIFFVDQRRLFPQNKVKFSFNMFGCWRDSYLYECQQIKVWGLSAEILAGIPMDTWINKSN